MTKTNTTEVMTMEADAIRLQVGDFITVSAWETFGQVVDVKPAFYGSDHAQRVLPQERPEAVARWYTLEPDEFTIES
jgi:hypothetical protein